MVEAKRKSSHCAIVRRKVYNGELAQTAGGLTKKDLTLNKQGQVVSKLRQQQGRKAMQKLKKEGRWAAPIR